VLQMHVSNVSSVLRHMLQVLHLDVSKVDRVPYLSPRLLLSRLSVSSSSRHRLGIRRPLLFSTLLTFGRRGPRVSMQNGTGNGLRARMSRR
jgi:hypothetical protein